MNFEQYPVKCSIIRLINISHKFQIKIIRQMKLIKIGNESSN